MIMTLEGNTQLTQREWVNHRYLGLSIRETYETESHVSHKFRFSFCDSSIRGTPLQIRNSSISEQLSYI